MPMKGRRRFCAACGSRLPPGLVRMHISCRMALAEMSAARDQQQERTYEEHETEWRKERMLQRGRHLTEEMIGRRE